LCYTSVDIIDNLYKLSVRIRTPTIRSRSLKAATYKPKDPDTGVDLLSTYAEYDAGHIKELLSHLRQPHLGDAHAENQDYLINRLSAAITLRRRQFKYWKRRKLMIHFLLNCSLDIFRALLWDEAACRCARIYSAVPLLISVSRLVQVLKLF
jgi:hypothetical protein